MTNSLKALCRFEIIFRFQMEAPLWLTCPEGDIGQWHTVAIYGGSYG